jgi:phosphate starvation-inducible protein PhoH and related proteins
MMSNTKKFLAKLGLISKYEIQEQPATAKGRVDSSMASKKKREAEIASKKVRSSASSPSGINFELRPVKPITENQNDTFQEWASGQNLILHGVAGTGKTFIALYLSLKALGQYTTSYDKVIIVRSVVPSRDMGFLPGDEKEKSEVFETPYKMICNQLYNRGDAYEILKRTGKIEFITTSFLRGQTFTRCLVIVDEVQNLLERELDTVLTRVGESCRIIVAGDYRQSDFQNDGENYQLLDALKILKSLKSVSTIEFGLSDIVRSGFAKEWIEARWRSRLKFSDKKPVTPTTSRKKSL